MIFPEHFRTLIFHRNMHAWMDAPVPLQHEYFLFKQLKILDTVFNCRLSPHFT